MLPALTAIGLFWYLLWRTVPNSNQNPGANPAENVEDEDGHDSTAMEDDRGVECEEVLASSMEEQRVPDEALLPLKELFTATQYQPLLERVMAFADPATVLRIASLSKYHNAVLTCSSVLQLELRKHYHRLPAITRRSPYHASFQRRTPASKQLSELISLQERISTVNPRVQQRLVTNYIDVLCSGDYVIVTRALRQKLRVEGNPDFGFMEDGWTILVRNGDLPAQDRPPAYPWEPSSTRTPEGEEEDEEEIVKEENEDDHDWEDEDDEPQMGRYRRRQTRDTTTKISSGELEGWEQWTVELDQDIADMTVRAEDDLVVIAHIVNQGASPPDETINLHFYHLETFEQTRDSPRRGKPSPHALAPLPVISYKHGLDKQVKIRLRAGPKGRLMLWVAEQDDGKNSSVMTWDWKSGTELGIVWHPEVSGTPHDFGFISDDIVLAAVLEEIPKNLIESTLSFNSLLSGGSPNPEPPGAREPQATRLALRFFQVPKGSSAAQTPNNPSPTWSFSKVPKCRPLSSFRLPPFTHKYRHKGEFPPDEVRPPRPQSFRLGHCSVAAKPAPVPLAPPASGLANGIGQGSAANACSGILVVTIEGDFGPIVHPGQPPHDHMSLAFATVSVPKLISMMRPHKTYNYKDWASAVSWDFGPMTWMTGYGNKTVQVSRFVSTVMVDEIAEDINNANGGNHPFANLDGNGNANLNPNLNLNPNGNGHGLVDDEDPDAGYTMLNVVMKDYNPVAIAHKGRTHAGALGAGHAVPNPDDEGPFPLLTDQNDPYVMSMAMSMNVPPGDIQALLTAMTQNLQAQGQPQGPGQGQNGGMPNNTLAGLWASAVAGLNGPPNTNGNGHAHVDANGANANTQFFANGGQHFQFGQMGPGGIMFPPPPPLPGQPQGAAQTVPFPFASSLDHSHPPDPTTRSITARVCTSVKHGKVYTMFGSFELESRLPYLEVNVNVPVEGKREGVALENPFKTVLCGDKLVVCDDAGFDILSF